MQFLRGLNTQYANVKSHVLLMEPLPSITKFFSFIAQQERQLSNSNFVASIKSTNVNHGKEGTSSITCSFCSRPDIVKIRVIARMVFPPTKKTKTIGSPRKLVPIMPRLVIPLMFVIRSMGILPVTSFITPRMPIVSICKEIVLIEQKNSEHANIRLTSQQYHTLLNLLQQHDSSQNSNAPAIQLNQVGSLTVTTPNLSSSGKLDTKFLWIFDSNATDHVCVSLNDFSSYQTIKPISVELPNGECVFATHKGIVPFTEKFILKDVLHIPDFHFNLIFISKLTSDLQYKLIFSSQNCIIQDLQTSEKIGIVSMLNGFYVLDKRIISSFINDVSIDVKQKTMILGTFKWATPLLSVCIHCKRCIHISSLTKLSSVIHVMSLNKRNLFFLLVNHVQINHLNFCISTFGGPAHCFFAWS